MYRKWLYSIYEKISNRDVLTKLKELENNQWLPLEELEKMQNRKLMEIINISINNIPYYRQIKNELGINLNDRNARNIIEQFPVLTKQDLISNYDNLVNPCVKEKVYKNFSGGSTGIPVTLLQDQIRNDYNSAATKRADRWCGLDFNSSVFQFWGASRDLKSNYMSKIRKIISKRYMFDAFNWNENSIVEIHRLIEKVKPEIILAYASALYFYVKTVKNKGLISTHTPKGIITSADMLYDYQRSEIEDYFNTKIFNRYGCREVGLIACECEEHNGLHISSDRLYIEIVDENNNSLPKGKVGKILITDLTNIAMPLLRYEVGDLGCLSVQQKCSCGRNLPKLDYVYGRIAEYIVTKNGNHIRVPAYIVAKFNNVKQMQLVQNNYDLITCHVVISKDYNKKEELKIIKELKKYILDNDMQYKFKYVDSIKNNNSGKFQFIVNDLL